MRSRNWAASSRYHRASYQPTCRHNTQSAGCCSAGTHIKRQHGCLETLTQGQWSTCEFKAESVITLICSIWCIVSHSCALSWVCRCARAFDVRLVCRWVSRSVESGSFVHSFISLSRLRLSLTSMWLTTAVVSSRVILNKAYSNSNGRFGFLFNIRLHSVMENLEIAMWYFIYLTWSTWWYSCPRLLKVSLKGLAQWQVTLSCR